MTSNAGASDVAKGSLGLGQTQTSQLSSEAIKKTFSPEFINRLDRIIYFRSLNLDLIKNIVTKFLNELKITLAQKSVDFSYSDAAVSFIAEKGYDPIYGARPLGRKIDEMVKSQIIDELLFGKIKNGGKIKIDFSQQTQHLVFDYN